MGTTLRWKALLICVTTFGVGAQAEDCQLVTLAPDWGAVRYQLSLLQTQPESKHIDIACVAEILQRPDTPAPVKLICMETMLNAGDAQQQKVALQWALNVRHPEKPLAEVETAGGWHPDRPAVAVFSWLDDRDPARWPEMTPELEAILDDVAKRPLKAGPPHEAMLVFSILVQYSRTPQTRSSLIRSAIEARPKITMFGYPGPEWLLPEDIQALRRTLSDSRLTLQSFHDAAASVLCLLGDDPAVAYLSRNADRVRASDPWLADLLANRAKIGKGMRSPTAFVNYLQNLSGSCAGVVEPLLHFAAIRFGVEALEDAGIAAALEKVRQTEKEDVERLFSEGSLKQSAMAPMMSIRLWPLKESAIRLGLLDTNDWPEIRQSDLPAMP